MNSILFTCTFMWLMSHAKVCVDQHRNSSITYHDTHELKPKSTCSCAWVLECERICEDEECVFLQVFANLTWKRLRRQQKFSNRWKLNYLLSLGDLLWWATHIWGIHHWGVHSNSPIHNVPFIRVAKWMLTQCGIWRMFILMLYS